MGTTNDVLGSFFITVSLSWAVHIQVYDVSSCSFVDKSFSVMFIFMNIYVLFIHLSDIWALLLVVDYCT